MIVTEYKDNKLGMTIQIYDHGYAGSLSCG